MKILHNAKERMNSDSESKQKNEITLFGIAASPGVAHGPIFRFLHQEVEVLNYEVKNNYHHKEKEILLLKKLISE